jgi:hypothetical protein
MSSVKFYWPGRKKKAMHTMAGLGSIDSTHLSLYRVIARTGLNSTHGPCPFTYNYHGALANGEGITYIIYS